MEKVITLLARVARYLVGIIFIFSGLIKLNDPVGTQIKLEEYFEVFAGDVPALHGFFEGLIPYALFISVILCAAEVVLGVALIFGYKPKTTSWLLLAIIVFFTFLTFYSAYFNKVTDCGCFGDAIKLKPWTSFGKDIFLLVLILLILYKRKTFKALPTGLIVAAATLGSFALAFYAIRHLPPIDMLPYKVGAHIPTQMKPSGTYQYEYIFKKNGETVRFNNYPPDTTLEFVDMKLLNEEVKPKITDYRTWSDEGDFTQETFQGKKLFIILKNLKDINTAAFPQLRVLVQELKKSGIQSIVLTSVPSEEIVAFLQSQQLDIPYYFADATVLKTISRSNPGLWLLQDGTVKGKWHYNDTPDYARIVNSLK